MYWIHQFCSRHFLYLYRLFISLESILFISLKLLTWRPDTFYEGHLILKQAIVSSFFKLVKYLFTHYQNHLRQCSILLLMSAFLLLSSLFNGGLYILKQTCLLEGWGALLVFPLQNSFPVALPYYLEYYIFFCYPSIESIPRKFLTFTL